MARKSRCEEDDGMDFIMETMVVSIMYIWVSSAAQRLCAWLILQLFPEIFRSISSMLNEATICKRVLGFDMLRVQITTRAEGKESGILQLQRSINLTQKNTVLLQRPRMVTLWGEGYSMGCRARTYCEVTKYIFFINASYCLIDSISF